MASPFSNIPSGRKLLVFDAAARTGSFTAAAREFNLTQPSVSRNMAEFEEHLGVLLFERGATGLQLTADGRELHAVVRDSLGRIDEAIRVMRERKRDVRPAVTMSISTSFATNWMVPRLHSFHQAFPQVDLSFGLTSGMLRSIPENVDLAIRIVPEEDNRYDHWDLVPEIITPVCSPGYIQRVGMLDYASDGSTHTFLHLSDHKAEIWGDVWAGALSRETRRATWLEFSDYAVILQAAQNGEGIALGWISAVSGALIKGSLVPASDRVVNTGKTFQLVRAKSLPARPVVHEICAWMVAEMQMDLAELGKKLPSLLAAG